MKLPARPLVLAAAWWVAAELVRRHPHRLRVIETHPGGGMYDCLSIYDVTERDPRLIVHLNMEGHLTPASWFGSDTRQLSWQSVIEAPDRRGTVIEGLERTEGLDRPQSTPVATAASVSVRVVAAFLERSCLATEPRWEMANGFLDTSGYDAGVREECFNALPLVAAHRRNHRQAAFMAIPEYRYWFVMDRERPVLAIDQVDGLAWTADSEVNLMQAYEQAGRSLDRLVSQVLPPAF